MKTKCFFMVLVVIVMLTLVGCLPASQNTSNETLAKVDVERIAEDASLAKSFTAEYKASTESVSPIRSLYNDLWTLPETIVTETTEVVAIPSNALLLLAAGGGSIALHASGADWKVAQNIENHGNMNRDLDKFGDYLGGPGQHFAAAGLWYLVSANSGDEFNKDRSWTMIKALSVTGATTLGLKIMRSNKTPNGKSLAWPSGHTSSSFTVAAVLDEFYGPEVGIPAYIGAGFVGYRMMDSGDHWASDVLFGGVLGYLVGHHVAGKGEDGKIAGFDLVPLTMLETGEPATGLMLVKQF